MSGSTPNHDYGDSERLRAIITKETFDFEQNPSNDEFWGTCWAATETVERLTTPTNKYTDPQYN